MHRVPPVLEGAMAYQQQGSYEKTKDILLEHVLRDIKGVSPYPSPSIWTS